MQTLSEYANIITLNIQKIIVRIFSKSQLNQLFLLQFLLLVKLPVLLELSEEPAHPEAMKNFVFFKELEDL